MKAPASDMLLAAGVSTAANYYSLEQRNFFTTEV